MGKITDALKKSAKERLEHVEKFSQQSEVRYEFIARKTAESKIDPRIVAFYEPDSPVTEQYRTLRTNILALEGGARPLKAIAITSSTHSEGKTITSINLAISMAHDMDKKRILLIDSDMRKSKIDTYLGIKAESGLSDILKHDAKIEDNLINIGIDNLTILPAGKNPKNPAELLASTKMKRFLNTMRENYDYIIMDTPPVIPVTDTGILGPQTDGVVMVIRAGRTQKGVVNHSQQLLKQAHAKLLGCILTNIQYHIPAYIYRYL